MKTIDKLIIKARNKYDAELKIAFIYPSESEPGKWVARGDIWNDIPGSGVTHAICDGCVSVDDAMQALDELKEKYPNCNDISIIIDDLIE
ncbi:MAG: hypothetical protein J6D02_09280 [Lachnospira sp.]|nr:hypothetical protein [Lachnospira sp.]